jgi:hypothetical protein
LPVRVLPRAIRDRTVVGAGRPDLLSVGLKVVPIYAQADANGLSTDRHPGQESPGPQVADQFTRPGQLS